MSLLQRISHYFLKDGIASDHPDKKGSKDGAAEPARADESVIPDEPAAIYAYTAVSGKHSGVAKSAGNHRGIAQSIMQAGHHRFYNESVSYNGDSLYSFRFYSCSHSGVIRFLSFLNNKVSKNDESMVSTRSCESAIPYKSARSLQSKNDHGLLEPYTEVKKGIEDCRGSSDNKLIVYSDYRPCKHIPKLIKSSFLILLSSIILFSTSLSCYPLYNIAYATTIDDIEDMPTRVPDNTNTFSNTNIGDTAFTNTYNNSSSIGSGSTNTNSNSSTSIDSDYVAKGEDIEGEVVEEGKEIDLPITSDRDTSNYEDKFTEPYVFKKHIPNGSYSFPIPDDPNDISTYDASYYGNNNYFADFTRLQLQEVIVKTENNISNDPSASNIQTHYQAAYVYLKNDWNYGANRTTYGLLSDIASLVEEFKADSLISYLGKGYLKEWQQFELTNSQISAYRAITAGIATLIRQFVFSQENDMSLRKIIQGYQQSGNFIIWNNHNQRVMKLGIVGLIDGIYTAVFDGSGNSIAHHLYWINANTDKIIRHLYYYDSTNRVNRSVADYLFWIDKNSDRIWNSITGKDINGAASNIYWRLFYIDKNIDTLLNGFMYNSNNNVLHFLYWINKNIDTIMNTLGAFKDSVAGLFAQQNDLINGINSKLITVYNYINSTNSKLDTTNTRLNNSNAKLDSIKGVLDAIETNTRNSDDDSGLSFIENINNILKEQLTVSRTTGVINYSNANLLWLIRDMAVNTNNIKDGVASLEDHLTGIDSVLVDIRGYMSDALINGTGVLNNVSIDTVKPSNRWSLLSYLYYIANKSYLIDKNLNTVTVSTKSPASSMGLVDLIYTIAQNVYDISNKIKNVEFNKDVTVDLTNIESILKGDLGGIKVSFDESDMKDILECLKDSDDNTVISLLKPMAEDVANTSVYTNSSTSILYSILRKMDDLDLGIDLTDVLANQAQANGYLDSISAFSASASAALERIENLFWGDYNEEYNYLAYVASASSKPSMRLYFGGDLVIESAYLLMKLEGSESTYVSQCQYPVNGSSTNVTVYDDFYLCQATYTLNSSYKASNGWYLVINTNKGQFRTEEFFTASSQQTLKDERIISGHYGLFDYLQKILDKKITLDGVSVGDVIIDLTDLLNALQSVQNKQDEINSKLGQLVEGLGDGVSLNTKGIEDKLSAIYNLLLTAGAIENAKDLTDLLIGDLDFTNVSGLASDVSALVNQAFPFCIPFLIKEALGMLEATPKAPVFTMSLLGAPLTLDFSDASGLGFYLAQFTRWFANISLALILIVGTKRFLFGIKGGGE